MVMKNLPLDLPTSAPTDILIGLFFSSGILYCVGAASATLITNISETQTKSKAKEKAIPLTFPTGTLIFRYGGRNPGNLTPRTQDVGSGLSFSTVYKHGSAATTIELINRSEHLYAVKDGPTHVSVRPKDGSMQDWITQGSDSIWTQELRKLCFIIP